MRRPSRRPACSAIVSRRRLSDAAHPPRIGLKGTAKVFGERVSLFYYLLRRPLAAARQFVGF